LLRGCPDRERFCGPVVLRASNRSARWTAPSAGGRAEKAKRSEGSFIASEAAIAESIVFVAGRLGSAEQRRGSGSRVRHCSACARCPGGPRSRSAIRSAAGLHRPARGRERPGGHLLCGATLCRAVRGLREELGG